jgi:hypothetical protein
MDNRKNWAKLFSAGQVGQNDPGWFWSGGIVAPRKNLSKPILEPDSD